ncbi:MAG TPA: hypothetical protein VLT59_10705, partial [Steroidobacteraceae bacterium]|nr:hypothetical protein [Steroidobacteraceae bacterium]
VARAALHRRCEDQYRLESLAAWLGVDLPHGDFARRATAVGQVALWCAAILQTSIGDLLDLPGGEFRSTVSDLPSLPPRSSATGT